MAKKSIVDKLNDPAYVRQLAEQHGIIGKDDSGRKKLESKVKRPELDEIPEDADFATIAKILNGNIAKAMEFTESRITDEFTMRESAVEAEKQAAEKAEQRKIVNELIGKFPDAFQNWDAIKRHYMVTGDLNEAYKAFREESGKPLTEDEEKKLTGKVEATEEEAEVKESPSSVARKAQPTDEGHRKVDGKTEKERASSIIDNVLKEHKLESLVATEE